MEISKKDFFTCSLIGLRQFCEALQLDLDEEAKHNPHSEHVVHKLGHIQGKVEFLCAIAASIKPETTYYEEEFLCDCLCMFKEHLYVKDKHTYTIATLVIWHLAEASKKLIPTTDDSDTEAGNE